MTFGALNRIPSTHLSDEDTTKASDIPLDAFLPDNTDWAGLKSRMAVIVQRIIANHCGAVNATFGDEVVEHIPNDLSELSSQKSNIVRLRLVLVHFKVYVTSWSNHVSVISQKKMPKLLSLTRPYYSSAKH